MSCLDMFVLSVSVYCTLHSSGQIRTVTPGRQTKDSLACAEVIFCEIRSFSCPSMAAFMRVRRHAGLQRSTQKCLLLLCSPCRGGGIHTRRCNLPAIEILVCRCLERIKSGTAQLDTMVSSHLVRNILVDTMAAGSWTLEHCFKTHFHCGLWDHHIGAACVSA